MDHTFTEQYWKNHYQNMGGESNLEPSPHLIATMKGRTLGTALDAGCGEGADAMWLARQGWKVKAVDISEIALANARKLSQSLSVAVDFEKVDLTAWTPASNQFDLVISQYVHTTNNQLFIKKLSAAVKPGGTLLIVGHQPPDAHESSRHAHGSHLSAEEVADYLETDKSVTKRVESQITKRIMPNGHTVTLNDSIFVAEKL